MQSLLLPVLLLSISNLFMTVAWYGHLKYKTTPLLLVILASWAIALIEYCFAVPANRWGHSAYSAAQLKTIQEVITLVVFAGFSVWVLERWLAARGRFGGGLGAWFIFRARVVITRSQEADGTGCSRFRLIGLGWTAQS